MVSQQPATNIGWPTSDYGFTNADSHNSRLGRWIGSFFIVSLDFVIPDPWKMPARKCHCDILGAIFVPRSLTASPIVLWIFFKRMQFQNTTFLEKQIPYPSPGQAARTKMTAIWFSSYDMFIKQLEFGCMFTTDVLTILWKTMFSV